LRVIRDLDLEPSWDLKQAKEPGFMRSLTTWVGGPKGYINSNLDHSVISERCAVGLMRMPVGNRQPGVHVHSVTEIYVILKGQVESFDGVGNRHRGRSRVSAAQCRRVVSRAASRNSRTTA